MEFNDSNSFLITQGDEKIYSIRVIGTYSNGSTDDLTAQVTWVSSNTEVVSVGLAESMVVLTAKEVGQANVFAKFGDIESENKIVVAVVEPEPILTSLSIELEETSSIYLMRKGEKSLSVHVKGIYNNEEEIDLTEQVIWNSSDLSVVTAELSGTALRLTGEDLGEANIFASFDGVESDNTINITVIYEVYAWGDPSYGGDWALEYLYDDLVNVDNVYATLRAYAAVKEDGTVVSWGGLGTDSSEVQDQLTDVVNIYSTFRAFSALKSDGSLVNWGSPSYGGSNHSELVNVQRVIHRLDGATFVALQREIQE